jgi:hypothetical protein
VISSKHKWSLAGQERDLYIEPWNQDQSTTTQLLSRMRSVSDTTIISRFGSGDLPPERRSSYETT